MENSNQTGLAPVLAASSIQPGADTLLSDTLPASKGAYIIGHITVKDADKWAEYCSKVPATVAPWGASLVFRGECAKVLTGDHAYTDTVVIRFPSRAAVHNWHDSAAYQALVPLRRQAADVLIISYDEQF